MQSDIYSYLHDQTLRLLNKGFVGAEIAECSRCPSARGSVAHPRLLRVGQPQCQGDLPAVHGLVRRQPRAPVDAPARGGGAALRRRDGRCRRSGVHRPLGVRRWGLSLGGRGAEPRAFADEEHVEARDLQAATFEQLAFGAENGTWRNAFLSGASELRHGVLEVPSTADAPELTAALTVDQVLSALAILVDGPRSWETFPIVTP